MANFKVVVSDPKTRKSYQKDIDQNASGLLGKRIRDRVSGSFFGLEGYELEITGGSDKDGFPMRPDVLGTGRKKVLLSFGPGFHPKRKGQRKKKFVRGNTISPEIVQVNTKIVKYGSKSVEASLGIKEKAEEKQEPEKQEEKKEETEKKAKGGATEKKEEGKKEEGQETKESGGPKEDRQAAEGTVKEKHEKTGEKQEPEEAKEKEPEKSGQESLGKETGETGK